MRYFDHNATHPMLSSARAAWLEAAERHPANPSSPHRLGSRSEAVLEGSRERLAALVGCQPADLVWTSGATESNNAVLHHLALSDEGEVWLSAIEHPCVLAAARRWLPGRHRLIPVTPEGVVDLAWLAEALRRQRPQAVGVQAANNETGVLQPWTRVRDLCAAEGVLFFCDAAQWLGKLPAKGLGDCAFLSGCGHKFGGGPGVGFLKVPAGFRPLVVGGAQEEGRRAGTENLPGACAMVAALADHEAHLAAGACTVRDAWRDAFVQGLLRDVPGTEVLGASVPRLWNTVAALMPAPKDCRRRWVVKLDRLGFAVSTGSACAAGSEKPSHVVTAMGRPAGESDRMLRFSAGWETNAEDWEALGEAVREAARELLES